jgi:predicted molibdopterin-dependent oxidoreductase YjgC
MSMVKFKIDNIEYESEDGTTILQVAHRAGISVPTLCHKDGIEHYSSCMVCMVKEKVSGRYIPSCSAQIQDGMDIDASGNEVIELRKKAVELLLSEHRAECEAPCRVVCPAGYNIPLMNRYLAANNFDEAVKLTLSEIDSSEILCRDCPGYCENACRRKKIDLPVSIRNTKLFISNSFNKRPSSDQISEPLIIKGSHKSLKERGKFASHIGKLEPDELKVWLCETEEKIERFREITDLKTASSEVKSCMHCDCRAAEDCRLRDIAGLLSVKDPRGKVVNAPIAKKINKTTGLIFENAKCIKCGLCVRICEDSTDEPVLCFINRGFVSIISEPLTELFDDVLIKKAGECIDICPTGALSYFNKMSLDE